LKYIDSVSGTVAFETKRLEEDNFEKTAYSDTKGDIHKSRIKRFSNMHDENIAEQFKRMQDSVMKKEIPILSRLLAETAFDIGYESLAEKYFEQLSEKYGIIANTVLINIYLANMYENKHLLKHLLYIVGNLPAVRRSNLEIIPLAGISNPDIEIQDLSVKCFEAWEDKRHLQTLISLRNKTSVEWFREYINDVIDELSGE